MHFTRRQAIGMLTGTAALSAAQLAPGMETPQSPNNLASDPRRPQFHFLPPADWMNDPNGPIYWDGSYHMFYQYNPGAAVWGDMHWGHAVSKDMIHWRHLPPALAPTPGGPDSAGCFSGTAVVRNGQVELLYTGVQPAAESVATSRNGANSLRETQCLAIAKDSELRSWAKLPQPVIDAPPKGLDVNGFRDPSPWRGGDWWYLVLGSGIANGGGALLLYRSKDLRAWEYRHIFARRENFVGHAFDPFDLGEVWECPEFFELGGRHVLILSTHGKVWWWSGQLDQTEMTFHPQESGLVDYGNFYAAKTQLDKSGNRVIWGWIPETRPVEEYRAAGWAGVMSLPRVLTIAENGRLQINPASETHQLRGHEDKLKVTSDDAGNQRQIAKLCVKGCCGEICCQTRTTEPFELALWSSEAHPSRCLSISFDPLRGRDVLIDGAAVPVAAGDGSLFFDIYIDGSVIETFVNGQTACTRRVYLPGDHPQDLQLRWKGATRTIAELSVWELLPISQNRLTSV